jgi:shikimate 5-dehydrogenase
MHPKVDATPVPREMLRPGMLVYDAVYNPLETRLLREAREAGCRTVAGIDHFVRQAVEQFELWTGRPAPVETMRRVVIEALTN